MTNRLKGCDSVYIALAAQLDEALVTFDNEQLTRGATLIRVERPE
jgi:predicted nucleic acid-binding protein